MKSTKQLEPGYQVLQWCWYTLEEMAPLLLYDMLALREAIFVVEQNCIYQELDGRDKTAQHLLAKHDGVVVACLRVLPAVRPEDKVRIGRVAVSSDWRKQGVARVMMQRAIEKLQSDDSSGGIYLDAQTYIQ